MDRIHYYANRSVQRGCAYALVFSVPSLIGLLKYPLVDLHSAAFLFTSLWLWLAWSAWRAFHTDYRRRIVWDLMDHWHGLPEYRAHQAISSALRHAFLFHADLAALAACGLWLAYFAAKYST